MESLIINKYSNGEIYEYLEERQEVWKKIFEDEYERYSSLISDYKLFLKACRSIVSELSVDDSSLSTILCIEKLIFMGKFSHLETFKYESYPNELTSNLGVNVILGKGCCRHLARFSKDLFDLSNLYCDNMNCLITEKECFSTLDGDGNHVINIIKFNGIYYGYDMVNHLIFEFKSPIELVQGSVHLYYKPSIQLARKEIDTIGLEERLKCYSESVGSSPFSKTEIDDIKLQTVANIIKKRKILAEFSNDTKEVKGRICSLCK